MDVGTAIPLSTGIIIAGVALLKYINIRANGHINNPLSNKDLSDRLSRVVYKDTCEANHDALDTRFEDFKDHVNQITTVVQTSINTGMENIRCEIKKHNGG